MFLPVAGSGSRKAVTGDEGHVIQRMNSSPGHIAWTSQAASFHFGAALCVAVRTSLVLSWLDNRLARAMPANRLSVKQ